MIFRLTSALSSSSSTKRTCFVLLPLLSCLLSNVNGYVSEEVLERKLNGDALLYIEPWTESDGTESLIARQFPKIVQTATDLELAKLGEIDLVTLRCTPNSCDGEECDCKVGYCKTLKSEAESNPLKYPTHNEVCNSEYCHADQKEFILNEVYDEIKAFDDANPSLNMMNPVELVVFDMGGTRASERFGVPLKSSCPSKKIISNAKPLTDAITMCDNRKNQLTRSSDCDMENVIEMVEKISYLMCRDDNPNLDGCVILLNPKASASVNYLKRTKIPLAYIYGPPELVLSDYPLKLEKASCNEYCNNRPDEYKEVIERRGTKNRDAKNLTPCETCATTLAINMENLLKIMIRDKKNRRRFIINTLDLPFALEPVIEHMCGETVDATLKQLLEEEAETDTYYGTDFTEYLTKKREGMSADCLEVAQELSGELFDSLELEDDEDEEEDERRKERVLKKKTRMTTWSS